jgi:hypothetical protein
MVCWISCLILKFLGQLFPYSLGNYLQIVGTYVLNFGHHLIEHLKIDLLLLYFIKNEAYTNHNDVWSLRFKLEVFIWRHVVNVPTSLTTFRGILICVIFRPGICKNIFLCWVLHWRIIRIKRFFSGVHVCVYGADALTHFK